MGVRAPTLLVPGPCVERKMVGAPGFEPRTSCSQSRRATGLRHAPTERWDWRLLTLSHTRALHRSDDTRGASVGADRPKSARAHRRGLVLIYGAGGIVDPICTDTVSDTAPPEKALTMAVPAVCSANSVVVVTPSTVRPSDGSTRPRVVWKVTTVSRGTGTRVRSVATTLSVVWPPSGMTGSAAVRMTIESLGANIEAFSHP